MMKKLVVLTFAFLLFVPAAQSADLLDWLKSGGSAKKEAAKPADNAKLLTLEPGESETYPKASPNGRMILTVVRKGKTAWISSRHAENGDPAHIVSEDVHALDSIGWRSNSRVYFLSTRAGSLGLWEKASDGKGMVRRLLELNGILTQPAYLPSGGMIAVRLTPISSKRGGKSASRDLFINWRYAGYEAHIVRIDANGAEHMLSKGINPALSPNGQWVVFSMPVGRSVHLFLMRVDGSDLIQLTNARSIDVQPVWSPDSKWIVFTSNRAQADMRGKGKSNWDVWAVDRSGRNLTQLTKDKARDGAPNVGSQGRVYFHSDRPVSKKEREARQVKGATRGFHIWTVKLPK